MPMNSTELKETLPGQVAKTDQGHRAATAIDMAVSRIGYSAKIGKVVCEYLNRRILQEDVKTVISAGRGRAQGA
jgi:hypothetical protein